MLFRVVLAVAVVSGCASTGVPHIDHERGPRARVTLAPIAADETVRVVPNAIEPMLPSADRVARAIATRLGSEATVDVRYCVSAAGKVVSAELARTSTYEQFDQAVMRDIVGWQFAAQPGPGSLRTCQDATIIYRPRRS
jgi:TonB family protein